MHIPTRWVLWFGLAAWLPVLAFHLATVSGASGREVAVPSAESTEVVANETAARKRDQWSFRLLKPSAMPTVRNPGRLRNPIDAFIQGKLESNGLEFSPDADNVTLMCRVYLALTEGKWRYRDYVIQCLNDDVPYDQLLLEQLAGDEIDNSRSRCNATGNHATPDRDGVSSHGPRPNYGTGE